MANKLFAWTIPIHLVLSVINIYCESVNLKKKKNHILLSAIKDLYYSIMAVIQPEHDGFLFFIFPV